MKERRDEEQVEKKGVDDDGGDGEAMAIVDGDISVGLNTIERK